MGRDVPFDDDEICDGCGALGAYDFYGDYFCQKCTDRIFTEREAARDLEAAKAGLADYEKNGGLTVEELKRELKIDK